MMDLFNTDRISSTPLDLFHIHWIYSILKRSLQYVTGPLPYANRVLPYATPYHPDSIEPQFRPGIRLGRSSLSSAPSWGRGNPPVYWQAGDGDLHMYIAFSSLRQLFWNYGIVLYYCRDIAVELNGGRRFTAASTLTTGLSRRGVIWLFFIFGWIPREQAAALATAPSW
jgi:hypothetical protein